MYPLDDDEEQQQNLFGLTPQSLLPFRGAQIFPTAPNVQVAEPSIEDQMNQLYQPQTAITEMYKQALQHMPTRGKPGLLSRIAGALSGFGPAGMHNGQPMGLSYDPQRAEQMMYAPYLRQMADWQTRVGALQKGAAEEEKENINRRTLALGTIQKRIGQQQADTAAQRANIYQQNADTRKLQVKINEFRANHPGWLLHDINGQVVAVNKGDPKEKEYLGDSNHLDDTTRMIMQLHNALEEITARIKGQKEVAGVQGAEARKTEETRQEGRVSLEGKRQEGRETNINLRTAAAAVKPTPPTKTVTTTEGGKEVRKVITGFEAPKAAPPAPKGWKYVPKPGGGWTAVRDESNK